MWWIALFGICALADPKPPLWPNKFMQTFNETTTFSGGSLSGPYTTKGTYYYDWSVKRYKVYRENGRHDRFCGPNGFKLFEDTPCSHIVVDGDRYLHYPEKNECCYCCSEEHGCGMLFPTWLQDAEYIGEEEHMGVKSYKWNKTGLQSNFYYETIAEDPLDRTMLSIYQESNDLQDFYGFSTNFSNETLKLPSVCSKTTTCSYFSTCTLLRSSF